MRLAEFIEKYSDQIVNEWEAFARTCKPASAQMCSSSLRDHAVDILNAIATDLRVPQTDEEQLQKSKGLAKAVFGAPETAAQVHAVLRAESGFNVNQLVAEYRALRASVLKCWSEKRNPSTTDLVDMTRFNEAIDQAVAESLCRFDELLAQGRNLMLGMLGHDMCSPLHAIRVTAMALKIMDVGTVVKNAADVMANSVDAMQVLVDDLTDLNRIQFGQGLSLRLQESDLARLFETELEIQRAALPEYRIELTVSGPSECTCDGQRIRQVLRNLVVNAAKYGKADCPVCVTLECSQADIVFCVVNDHETGTDELDERVFSPLSRFSSETGDSVACNLGLGLYITRAIVRAHGGEINVQSDGDKTKFRVQLPKSAH
ncbi:MAG: sensor histidine kinase [Pirellulales bacterium]